MRASGADSLSRTTYFETASALRIVAGTFAATVRLPGGGGFFMFLTEYTTSSAVSSLPLWNFTPLRRLKIIDVLLSYFHDVASAGLMFSPLSNSASES